MWHREGPSYLFNAKLNEKFCALYRVKINPKEAIPFVIYATTKGTMVQWLEQWTYSQNNDDNTKVV